MITATKKQIHAITSRGSDQVKLQKNEQPCVVDLCCGLGALSLAAEQIGMTVVAGVDMNAHALKTFGKNFPKAQAIEGDIQSESVIQKCADLFISSGSAMSQSVVVSGPPCQGFSMAGPRDPADPRNQILIAAARAIVRLQPKCAVIENVSMVLADRNDTRIGKLEKILTSGGFFVTRIMLNAAEFGTPQKRKRVFFLITRNKLDEADVMRRLEVYKSPTKGAKEVLRGLPKAAIRPDKYNDETDCGIVSNHFAMQHSKRVMNKIVAIKPGSGPMSYRRLHPTRPSNTLFSGHRAPPAHFKEPRSITVREAARLQSIPDSFRIYGSFASQMEQVTNAVPPMLARPVLEVLLELSGLRT